MFIQLFTGLAPFGGGPGFVAAVAIVQGKRPPQPSHPTFTVELWALTQRCWDQDPHLRPEVLEVLRELRSFSVSRPLLEQLHHLDRSSSAFHDRLIKVLYGKEYQQCVPNLQGDDLVWLVDYLDKARHVLPLPAPHSLLKPV